MAIASVTPNKAYQALSGLLLPKTTITSATLTTAGGARTSTIAELLGGILVLNVDDAQTLNLPTGALLNAGLRPYGVEVGMSFEVLIINVGDTTLTVSVGTGGSLVVGNSKSSVATVVSNASKRLLIRVTGVKTDLDPTSSDTYTVYTDGSTAASVA